MRIIESVPIQDVLAHQRPKRTDYPPAGIALDTLVDPHWSELTAYLVELETADAADIFLYWEYRTLLRGWGSAGFQPEYTLARLNVGEPEVGAALWKRGKGKRRDLRGVEGREPILVAAGTSGMPMTVTDGNLRLINQFPKFSLDGFRAFLCVHPKLGFNCDNQWFITQRAHEVAQFSTHEDFDGGDGLSAPKVR
jgi:hypothetical protein